MKSTFILVHGALFRGAGWKATEEALQSLGHKTISFDVPGRAGDGLDPRTLDLEAATQKLIALIKAQSGRVVLVGHSQGGALINQAVGSAGEKIQALIYLAAVLPLQGETGFQGLDPAVDTGFAKVTHFDEAANLFRVNKKGPIHEVFFGDLNKAQAEIAIAAMVPEPVGIGTTKMTTENKKIFSIPAFYIEATDDKVISIQSQRRIYSRVPGIKVFSMQASHCPFLSKPGEVASYLDQAAEETA
jgi:pimeloyl-ACP methyl ester carboxylesterase